MIQLKTFGTPVLRRGDEPASPVVAHRRRIALLALLAAAGDDGMSRDKLVGYLWAGAGEEHARHTLAQTLYLLRRGLAGVPIVLGTADLRLDPGAIETDVAGLRAALTAGDVDRAAALYAGPFLDGFYLPRAPEFERWVERQRGRFAGQVQTGFERTARDAAARGDWQRAVEWWRRVAALDPLDARVAVALMESLAAIGDRSAALHHARLHEALVREELDALPDPAVAAVTARLRARVAPAAAPRVESTLAIGAVRDYDGTDTSGVARALTDVLVTNLARVPGVRVVSNARVQELIWAGPSRDDEDLSARISCAARQAGASEIVEGTMYRLGPTKLRFDVRRIDLATGAIRKAYSVAGGDAFEVVDRATSEVAADLGAAVHGGATPPDPSSPAE